MTGCAPNGNLCREAMRYSVKRDCREAPGGPIRLHHVREHFEQGAGD